jgi:hypothetical protein
MLKALFGGVKFSVEVDYRDSGRCPSSCLLFKTQLNSIGLSVPHRIHFMSPLEPNMLMISIGL